MVALALIAVWGTQPQGRQLVRVPLDLAEGVCALQPGEFGFVKVHTTPWCKLSRVSAATGKVEGSTTLPEHYWPCGADGAGRLQLQEDGDVETFASDGTVGPSSLPLAGLVSRGEYFLMTLGSSVILGRSGELSAVLRGVSPEDRFALDPTSGQVAVLSKGNGTSLDLFTPKGLLKESVQVEGDFDSQLPTGYESMEFIDGSHLAAFAWVRQKNDYRAALIRVDTQQRSRAVIAWFPNMLSQVREELPAPRHGQIAVDRRTGSIAATLGGVGWVLPGRGWIGPLGDRQSTE